MSDCPLCGTPGGTVLWENPTCRVVLADEPDHPGFLRVIAREHVKEMTDLPPDARHAMMDVVFAAEAALRETLSPDKINLATLGNVVPHLHWHVIPRFADDPHFPNAVWGARLRDAPRRAGALPVAALVAALSRRLGPVRGAE